MKKVILEKTKTRISIAKIYADGSLVLERKYKGMEFSQFIRLYKKEVEILKENI